jgi:hypothetical protein
LPHTLDVLGIQDFQALTWPMTSSEGDQAPSPYLPGPHIRPGWNSVNHQLLDSKVLQGKPQYFLSSLLTTSSLKSFVWTPMTLNAGEPDPKVTTALGPGLPRGEQNTVQCHSGKGEPFFINPGGLSERGGNSAVSHLESFRRRSTWSWPPGGGRNCWQRT